MQISTKLLPIALYIQHFISVKDEELFELLDKFEYKEYKKEQKIYTGGEVCKYLYFLVKGIVREEEKIGSQKRITWLTFDNEVFTDIYGFVKGQQSPHAKSFVACTEVELFRLEIAVLHQLYEKNPLWERLGRLVAEHYILLIANQADFLLKNDAKKRYQELISKRSTILQELSLSQIASFLGITLPSLSRIRAGKC